MMTVKRDVHCPKVFAFMISFLLAAVCVSPTRVYSASELPTDKTARIEAASGISLESVDGKKVSGTSVKVPPGYHTVEMSMRSTVGGVMTIYSSDNCFLVFTAEEGHTYRVDTPPLSGNAYTGVVRDRTTNQEVTRGCVIPPEVAERKIGEMETAIKRDPRNPGLWMNKGVALETAKRYEEALTAFETAVSLAPGLPQAWSWKSRVLLDLKRYDEALNAIDKAISLKPDAQELRRMKETTVAAIQRNEKAPQVADWAIVFDGNKMLFPPKDVLPPADISEAKFDLSGVPDDRKFLVGKVYRAAFGKGGIPIEGAVNYFFLTQWAKEKIQLFYWPISLRSLEKYPTARPLTDCAPVSATEYSCTLRGMPEGIRSKVIFRDQKISVISTSATEADLIPVGEIPESIMVENAAALSTSPPDGDREHQTR
jgi:hypothetical protein